MQIEKIISSGDARLNLITAMKNRVEPEISLKRDLQKILQVNLSFRTDDELIDFWRFMVNIGYHQRSVALTLSVLIKAAAFYNPILERTNMNPVTFLTLVDKLTSPYRGKNSKVLLQSLGKLVDQYVSEEYKRILLLKLEKIVNNKHKESLGAMLYRNRTKRAIMKSKMRDDEKYPRKFVKFG